MPSYSISVALFDYLPVLASLAGMLALAPSLARLVPHLRSLIVLAALAIPLAGACKASWKLLIALGHAPIPWLENMLFILLAPGFIVLAHAMRQARGVWQGTSKAHAGSVRSLTLWLLLSWPVALVLALSMPQSRLWFFYLLAVTTLANAGLILQSLLSSRAAACGWRVNALLVLSFAATMAMSGLARLPDTETTAWIQESVNLLAQTSLALAFWQLARALGPATNRPGAASLPPQYKASS